MPTPYTSARLVTPGTLGANGSAVCIACSAAGTVNLIMTDATVLTVYASVGTAIIDNLAVKGVQPGGTATATVSVLA